MAATCGRRDRTGDIFLQPFRARQARGSFRVPYLPKLGRSDMSAARVYSPTVGWSPCMKR
eukprot:1148439-Lingulodinium_polyedra.AAC.1